MNNLGIVQLDSKIAITCKGGGLEDSTFKAPFVSHRISYPLIRNSVYKFNSAYVHEFEDKSVLLIVTEHMKIEPKNVDDYRDSCGLYHCLYQQGNEYIWFYAITENGVSYSRSHRSEDKALYGDTSRKNRKWWHHFFALSTIFKKTHSH